MRRTLPRSLLCLVLLAGSCNSGEPTPAPSPAAAERDASLDARDQYALAHAIAAARASHDQLEAALGRTRSAWIGRRYRWELAYVPALCGPTGPCVVMPFDHQRDPEQPIRQGWLPRLELPQTQRDALRDACQDHRQCVVELTGRLGQLELSTEQPVSMTLSEVEILRTRDAAPGESWVLAPRRVPARRGPSATATRSG